MYNIKIQFNQQKKDKKMKINSLYPVITTDKIETTKDFYKTYLDLVITFDSDWYISMRTSQEPFFELALLDYKHPSLPEAFQHPTNGVLINLEVGDVDAVYDKFSSLGIEMVLDIQSEDWGQRHFIVQDPNGLLIDVIQNIGAKGEYKEQYQ